jgi:hypothetical protein
LEEAVMTDVTERCPWCGSLIARAKFLEIEERIRQEERKKLADIEAATRERLEKKFKADFEQAKKTALEAEASARRQLEATLTSTKAERDRTLEKMKTLEARETGIRKEAAEEAAKAVKRQLDEHRLILEREHAQAMNKLRAEFTREREAAQKKVGDLERQLQKKTPHELGDGAEIDLYQALREGFPGDRVTRVPKGEAGADIHHEVLYKGDSCGLFVIDSKNRKLWQNLFASKLHEDKVAAKAQHAILATNIFPAGRKGLCQVEDVLVMSPAHVVVVLGLLRAQLIQMHLKGLSMRERNDKMARLYAFITSQACAERLKEADRIADRILDLDVRELKEHEKTWRERGGVARRLKAVLRDLTTEVTAIVEGEQAGSKTA